MKTSKHLLLGAALLAGTCFSVGSAWSQGDTRLREGAPIGTPLNPGTSDPARVKKVQQALKDTDLQRERTIGYVSSPPSNQPARYD